MEFGINDNYVTQIKININQTVYIEYFCRCKHSHSQLAFIAKAPIETCPFYLFCLCLSYHFCI